MLPEDPDLEITVLPPDELKFLTLPNGKMVMIRGDEAVEVEKVLRALPISDPWRYLVVYASGGTEVGVIEDISELDPDSQKVLRHHLEERYRTFVIKRIIKVERLTQTGHSRWVVETNEGVREFTVSGTDHIHTSRFPRIFIRDAQGDRYEIPNFELLDPKSRRTAREFI